ncbi:mitochondrial inner membrane protease subunit 2-like protein, partial [Leptotrombidium deliense]
YSSQTLISSELLFTVHTLFNCSSPKNPEQKLIKRVIALEGDIVRSTASKVIKIPKGHCWVEGDHTRNSLDSNHFGPVAVGLLHSHATHILWPPRRWSKINDELPKKTLKRCSY